MNTKHNMGRAAALMAAICAVSGCATMDHQVTPQIGMPPVCAPGVDLGNVAVTLSTRWRPDQKEARAREQMASKAIGDVFASLRCGRFVGQNAQRTNDVQTQIEIELREFGPSLMLSVPVIWSLKTDVDYTMTVRNVANRIVRLRISERRSDGGAFVVQSIEAVPRTFEASLRNLLYGDGSNQKASSDTRNRF